MLYGENLPESELCNRTATQTLLQEYDYEVLILDPNSVAGIRLRGSNSILGSQEPLIIVDGIIAGGSSNLKDINMEDVESIEVIKGAAASSLYGSLSGNGVIQIITKRGKNTEGKNRGI